MIAHLISPDQVIFTCDTTTRVRDAVDMLAKYRIGAMPVLDNNEVVGIFSERDIVVNLSENSDNLMDRPVGDLMTQVSFTVTPETSIIAALSLMTHRRVRHLPVLQEGMMIGFVSIGDLVKHRLEKMEAETEAMRMYIQS